MMNDNNNIKKDKDIQKQKPMSKPSNDIDLQAMTVQPFISSEFMSDRIRNKFRKFGYVTNEKGEIVKDEEGNDRIQVVEDLWSTMELFTQDFRLGNLNKDEGYYVRYNLDLCSDILTVLPDSFSKPALILLERSISVTETSQSKGGFLRRLFNTFFQNSSVKEESPTKRTFFGLGKKQ